MVMRAWDWVHRLSSKEHLPLARQSSAVPAKMTPAKPVVCHERDRWLSESAEAAIPEPVQSPGAKYERTTSPEGVQSAGGLPKINEKNPFFQSYDEEYDKKGASIKFAQQQERTSGSDQEPSSRPNDTLRRTVTEGSAGVAENEGKLGGGGGSGGGGFLSRVKSLRKNKPKGEGRQ